MTSDSWPSSTHTTLTDPQYERIQAPGLATAVVGLPADTAFVYGDSSGRQVKVRANKYATVRGHGYGSGGADITLAIAANSSGSTRIDLVVLRYTRATGDVEEVVKTGTTTVTQDAIGSGVWELPLAEVEVPNGASVITAGNVTRKEYFIGSPPIVCTSTTRPPHFPGLRIYETDTGRTYTSNGTDTWVSGIEDTGWVNQTPGSGWTAPYGFRARRYNGLVVVEAGGLQRSGGPIAKNVASTVGSLAAGFRPDQNASVLFHVGNDTNQMVNAHVAPGGALIITNFPAIPTGGFLLGGTATYPMGS